MILLGEPATSVNNAGSSDGRLMADYEPRMLLKTISSAPQRVELGATLGATRMNNLGMLRTHVDKRERQARGHELL